MVILSYSLSHFSFKSVERCWSIECVTSLLNFFQKTNVIITTNMVSEKLNVKTLKFANTKHLVLAFFFVQFRIFLELFSGLVMLNYFLAYSIG